MPESVSSCCPSARHAGRFDCLMSTEQPHSDNNEQWQGALCMVAVLQGSQPNPQRNWKLKKMYAIKQIKICAEYRDMLPRPRLDLSGTPGLRPIGLSPGSWQTSLGLGSMSRYSAQILICITKPVVLQRFVTIMSPYSGGTWPGHYLNRRRRMTKMPMLDDMYYNFFLFSFDKML